MLKLEELIGQKVHSWGRTLSEAEFSLLNKFWGEGPPSPANVEDMKRTGGGEGPLSGALLLCIVGGLAATSGVRNLMLQCDWRLVAVIGLEDVKIVTELRPGDTVRVETTFRELRPTSKDTRKILALEQIAFNQRDEKVLENTQLVLFEKP
jgi:acyl dehydratase